MSSIPITGAPDWQHITSSSQSLLATVPAPNQSVTITVPPNAETIVVLSIDTVGTDALTVKGVDSSHYYFNNVAFVTIGGHIYSEYFIDVSDTVDGALNISFASPMTDSWYVYSDQESHLSFDPNIGLIRTEVAQPLSIWGIMAMSSDGNDSRFISSDLNGRLIPLVPTNSTGMVATGQILPAPINAWYLFSTTLRNLASSNSSFNIYDTAGNYIVDYRQPANSDSLPIALHGYRVTTALTLASDLGNQGQLLYAAGP